MIDFVPLENYFFIFLNAGLITVLFSLLHIVLLPLDNSKNLIYMNIMGYALLVFLILYMGLRPISGRYFGDMRTYSYHFIHYAQGGVIMTDKDLAFHYFMKFCSQIMGVHSFFLICASIYILPLYKFSKTFLEKYWFYGFLMFVTSFSFWTYGVNGIRNGMAASLFLWGLTYQRKKVVMLLIFTMAISIHKTMLLPVSAYLLTYIYNNPQKYFFLWLLSIPFSFVLGGAVTSVVTSLGFGDERLGAYLSSSGGGFRIDFIIYSSAAVFVGYYFILKQNFKDKFYYHLYNTYLLTNAFWILVIRANFSNRFAYLSWFMMAIIVIYPFLKNTTIRRNSLVAKVILCYFAFTYLMAVIYYADPEPVA